MKDPFYKSPEEIKISMKKDFIDNRIAYLKAILNFSEKGDMETVGWINDIMDYNLYLNKISKKDRLSPSGQQKSIMLVGINPSIRSSLEDVWTDPYGKYLKGYLKEAGLNPKKIWITNLYKKTTPENRPLNEKEINEGIEELALEIRYVRPSIVVLFGKQVHSFVSIDGYKRMMLPHPSFINRYATPEQKAEFINQLKSLKKYEKT